MEKGYWYRQAIGRRRFLGAVAATGLTVAGCGGSQKQPGTPTPVTRAARTPATSTATPASSPAGTAPAQPSETLRYSGFVVGDGRWDPHRTQAGPFLGQQSLVFSRLIAYKNQRTGDLEPDLAEALPEQPDPLTLVFRLRGNAHWHDRAPLSGRLVTAEDVKFSIERQRDGDGTFAQKARWQNAEAVTIPEPGVVSVKLKAANAAMLHAFADVSSLIVAPELSPNGASVALDQQIGSGPFRWVEWNEGQFASVARNAGWHGGEGRPLLSGIDLLQARTTDEVESLFRVKALDAAVLGKPQAEALQLNLRGELQAETVGHAFFYGMRFFVQQAPFTDPRVRTALSLGVNRRALIAQLFSGSGEMNPWISWPVERWSLPQAELVKLAGYREGQAGRDQDIAEAKALLAAAGVGREQEIPLFVVEESERVLGLGSTLRDQLRGALGLNIGVYASPLGELLQRLFQGKGDAAWVAGADFGALDLDDWTFPYFHSSGAKNTMALRDAELDSAIAAQRAELDEAKRRELGYAIQRRLLTVNAAVNFVSERVVSLAWPYVRNFPMDIVDGYQHRFADTWIDRGHPSIRGRA